MTSQRASILGKRKAKSESRVVQEALKTYLAKTTEQRSAYDLAKQIGLIGCVRRAPKDLSTNRRHFFGR